jgi:hypothetical protein
MLPPHGDWLSIGLSPDTAWSQSRLAVPCDHSDFVLHWAAVGIGDRSGWGPRLQDESRCYIGQIKGFKVESQSFYRDDRYHRCETSNWFNCTWLVAMIRSEADEQPERPLLWRSRGLDAMVHWQHGPDAEGLWQLRLSLIASDRSARQDLHFDGMSPVLSWSHSSQT